MARQRCIRLCVTAVIVGLLVASVPTSPATARKVRRYGRIGSGVVHKVIRQRKPRRVIHVVVADVAGRAALKVALSNGSLPGLEKTSSMARRHGAIAAINGDFFRPSGRPVAAFAKSGHLVQKPLTWGANLAFSRGGRKTHMGHPKVTVQLVGAASGATTTIARVNQGRPRRAQLRLYTKQGGRLARPPRNSCSARVRRTGPNRFDSETERVMAPVKVVYVACRKKRMGLGRGMVVAARRWGQGKKVIRALRSNRRQKLGWSLGWPNVAETIGGNPVLIKDGELAWSNLHGSHPLFRSHPRTGVGIRADGKILLVTVDGRRPRYSRGMTMLGFARFMKSLGAEWALNLDGGGSTTMVVKGRVMNRPSDGRERPVGSALLIVGKRSRYRSSLSLPDPSGDDGPATSERLELGTESGDDEALAFDLAERDPASIGGLASWLSVEGQEMPRGLAGVARDFDRDRFQKLTRGLGLPPATP